MVNTLAMRFNRLRWVGRLGYYWQPDSSDYWVRARVYRPQLGRWGSRDPLCSRAGVLAARVAGGGTCHTYRYTENSPLLAVDPSGLGCTTAPTPCASVGPTPGSVPPRKKPRSDCHNLGALLQQIQSAKGYWFDSCLGQPPGGVSGCVSPVVAVTGCCETEEGCCQARVEYCPDYNHLQGCEQYCFDRHENEHVEQCRIDAWGSGYGQGECLAYGEELRCLCRALRDHFPGSFSQHGFCVWLLGLGASPAQGPAGLGCRRSSA